MKKTLAASAALIALLLAGCAPSPTPVHPKFASYLHDLACADDGTVVPEYEQFSGYERTGTWVTPEACAAGPAHEAFDFPDDERISGNNLSLDPVVQAQLWAYMGPDFNDKARAALAYFEFRDLASDGWTLDLSDLPFMTLAHTDGRSHTVDLRRISIVDRYIRAATHGLYFGFPLS